MTIAIITTFTDNLLKAKLVPLSKVDEVSCIALVCDRPGPAISKVRYVTPPRWLYWVTFHKAVAKLLMLVVTVWRENPAMVMAYTLFPHGVSAWLVARIFGKPNAVHLTGGYIELVVEKDRSDNSLVKTHRWFAPFVESISRNVIRRMDHIMVPGHVTEAFLREKLGIGSDRIVFLHSTIDTAEFTPAPEMEKKEFDLIFVANLRRLKRADVFIETVGLMKAVKPDIKSVIVGDGEGADDLKRMVEEKGLAAHVYFAGDQRDPRGFYRRSRIFLLPSRAEGLSTAVMEGMACGIPAVTADVGDMRDIIIEHQTGSLVPDNANARDFATAVHRMLDCLEMDPEIPHHCRSLIEEHHSFPVATRSWKDFFRQAGLLS